MMGALVVYGAGATLEQVAVNDNATQGLAIGTTGVTLRHVTADGNGLLGIQAAYADGLVLDGVRTEGNNSEHFNSAPVSGGIKIARSRGIVVRDSVVAGNAGMGLWFDESCYGITVVGDDSVGNAAVGIVLELSDTAVVADNVVSDNGEDGIQLHNTGHVQVWSNTVLRNRRDIDVVQDSRSQFDLTTAGHDPRQTLPDPTVPWLSQDITVRDNILGGASGNAVLGVEDYSHRYSAAQLRVSLDSDAYSRASASAPSWLVVWSAGSGNNGNPFVLTGLPALVAQTGQEAHGQELLAPSADPALFPDVVLAPLPADVAAATGRTAGAGHLGAWS
jgi:parallel beta-helix repeat protein